MNDIELIDAYLLNTMPADERKTFEQRLSADTQLRKDVNDVDHVIEGLRGVAFKAKLQEYHKAYHAEDNHKTNLRLYYISGIAASVLVALTVSWYVLFFDKTDKYYAYFEPYPAPVVVRSGVSQVFEEALLNYERGEYAQAVTEFELGTIVTNETTLYLALSYLGDNQPERAIPIFKSLLTTEFAEQARWYMGLSLLLNDQTTDAQETLSQIKPGEYQYDKAQEILKDIH